MEFHPIQSRQTLIPLTPISQATIRAFVIPTLRLKVRIRDSVQLRDGSGRARLIIATNSLAAMRRRRLGLQHTSGLRRNTQNVTLFAR